MSSYYWKTAALCAVMFCCQSVFAQVGDPVYGKELLAGRRCTTCHSVAGEGGGSASDLGKPSNEQSSPAALTARMWVHGPVMWAAAKEKQAGIAALTPLEIANFYAYLYSLRYFDPPGDADRGKGVFASKRCSQCHADGEVAAEAGAVAEAGTAAAAKPGPPVAQWLDFADRVTWLSAMWNHGASMEAEMKRLGADWPRFSLQEMVDLLTYLENHPDLGLVNPGMQMGDWTAGEDAFADQGCAGCHTVGEAADGKIDLVAAAKENPQLTGLAVAMWNHRPEMAAAASQREVELKPLDESTTADLLAYLFQRGYFSSHGDADRGKTVFGEKSCARCHEGDEAEAPKLSGADEPYNEMRLAAAVFGHGLEMKAEMDFLEIEWPELSEQDVLDLIAFLNRN